MIKNKQPAKQLSKKASPEKGKLVAKNATASNYSKQSNQQNKTMTAVKKPPTPPKTLPKANTNKTVTKIKQDYATTDIKPFQSNASYLMQRYRNAQRTKDMGKLKYSLAQNIINLINAEKKMFKYFLEERRKLFVESSLQQIQVSPSFYKIFEKFESLCNGICNVCEPIVVNLQNMLVLLHMSKVFGNPNKNRNNGFFRLSVKKISAQNIRKKSR